MKPILIILIFIVSYPLYSQSVKDTLLEIFHTDVYFRSNRMYFSGYSNAQMKYPMPKTEEEQKANHRVEVIIKDCGEVERKS